MGSVGRTIKKLRTTAAIKQGVLAERVGVTQSYLSAVEADKKTPSPELVDRISRELGLPSNALYSLTLSPDEAKPEYREILRKLVELQELLIEQMVVSTI